MNIGLAIKSVRLKRGLTQKELAKKSTVSINTICSVERGNTFPNKDTLYELSKALGVSRAFLLLSSINERDLPTNKKNLYKELCVPLREELLKGLD